MNYLISRFACIIKGKEELKLKPMAKYCFDDISDETYIVFSELGEIAYAINFYSLIYLNATNKYVLKFEYGKDTYLILTQTSELKPFVTSIKYLSTDVIVSLSSELDISISGECVLNRKLYDIKYSHFEIEGNILIIYFTGKRNYVVVIDNKKLKFDSYYDECNVEKDEKYFMCKCYDIINHGSVCHIKDKEVETYLVYLDDFELKLKREFVACVFLDCVRVKNYKYANSMLDSEIANDDANNIGKFFPQFDNYYIIDNNLTALINKNTLAGIYKFEIENLSIRNIVEIN